LPVALRLPPPKLFTAECAYLEEAVRHLDPAQYEVVQARATRAHPHAAQRSVFFPRPLEFLIPCPRCVHRGLHGLSGMKLYEWIAGKDSLFPSKFLSKKKTLERMPGPGAPTNLSGASPTPTGNSTTAATMSGLINTFVEAGGEVLNYARSLQLHHGTPRGKLSAAEVEDRFSKTRFHDSRQLFL